MFEIIIFIQKILIHRQQIIPLNLKLMIPLVYCVKLSFLFKVSPLVDLEFIDLASDLLQLGFHLLVHVVVHFFFLGRRQQGFVVQGDVRHGLREHAE